MNKYLRKQIQNANLRINRTGEPLGTGLNKAFSHSSSWLAWTWTQIRSKWTQK